MKENDIAPDDKVKMMRKYWKNKLSGEITSVNLDVDFNFSIDFDRNSYKMKFEKSLNDRLMKISKNQDLPAFAILLAVFKALILKYTQQNDIIVVTPLYKMDDESISKYVILRDYIDSRMTFRDILTSVKRTLTDGYGNQEFPARHILDEIGISREAVLKIIMSMKGIHHIEHLDDIVNSSLNNFAIEFSKEGDTLVGDINYNSALFTKDSVSSLARLYLYILNIVLENPDRKILDFDMILEDEKSMIFKIFNNTQSEYPREKTIQQVFEETVVKFENNIAVESEGEALTFAELNMKANQLAHSLRAQGVKTNDIVAIMTDRSVYMIIGILGILKSGAAYLPIDPEYPGERIRYMLSDSESSVLILRNHLTGRIKFNKNVIIIDAEDNCSTTGLNPENINKPGDLAYVIYTSGSTGKPKGVMIEHRNIHNYVAWRKKAFNFSPVDTTLQLISYSFDGFGSNFYSSILSGGKLIIPGDSNYRNYDYIRKFIDAAKVTNIGLVPSMYRAILEKAGESCLQTLRIVTLAGEKADRDLIEKSNLINPNILLVNEYGPSESTIASTVRIGMTPETTSIIGRPIDNIRVYIMDKDLKLMPIGIRGELFVSGDGIARGYLKREELTRKKFIVNPYITGEKLYRTGDLARWLPDGEIEFLGRIDHQIKIRGFRVEIGEIESKLFAHKQIKEAIVIDLEDTGNNKYLCAYLVSNVDIKPVVLREYLSKELPDYMIPSFFVRLECFPLTPNGKIDKKALPEPDLSVILADDYIPPKDKLEEKIQKIWQDVLEFEKIGMNHDFFILGGNSLKAMKVVSDLEKDHRVDVNDIYDYSTIRKLSGLLKEK